MIPKIPLMNHFFSKQGCAIALVLMPSTVAIAGQAGWAHQVGGMQSNGQVIVKSLSGASYSATQNPVGAVAKANQNAATQPPTVIIQATAAATRECQPKIKGFGGINVTMPACPAGYTSIFQESAALSVNSCPLEVNQTYNIAGTNWSFGLVSVSNAQAVSMDSTLLQGEFLTFCRMVKIASIYAACHQAVYRFGHNAIRAPRPL